MKNHTYEIFQPSRHSTLSRLGIPLSDRGLLSSHIAAAYITDSGLNELLRVLKNNGICNNKKIGKNWITSFDYCRTSPRALRALLDMPGSKVRIYNPTQVLKNKGIPKKPFHPKAFLFKSKSYSYALTGSGNISRSGLKTGVEAGLLLKAIRNKASLQGSASYAIRSLNKAFKEVWKSSALLDEEMLSEYTDLYSSIPATKNVVPTEDDLASGDTGRGALSANDLKKLRVCRYLWVEAGNVTKNRGKQLPGNQLMMKRMSRVFFGFPPDDLEKNTAIGKVEISFDGGDFHTYSLTYSDNGMDKLTLPMPATLGPEKYDQKFLLFEKVGINRFLLSVRGGSDRQKWLKLSKKIQGSYKFSSGREWGVFQQPDN